MALIEINWRPNRRQLRTFGCAGAVVLAGLGAWTFFRHHLLGFGMSPGTARSVAVGLWIAAGHFLGFALAAPTLLRPVYLALTVVSLPIGLVLSHVILAVVYYGLFMPTGLIFRLIGRDALHRRFDPNVSSYWTPRPGATDVRRYFRQF